ncbi:MAG TPA: group II intron reverse transcriptase/maturase [Candidatus Polarisedimenticolia bacterium]|nr:group II intron reverse transcriptase/maturase [Candidatus Polarisedimenticolia bacterium]
MDGRGKSDGPVVPGKPPNEAWRPAKEAVEGRGPAKGNRQQRNALRTQSRAGAPSALERVRQAARRDRKQRFTALLHHVYDIERLRAAYLALKRDAAAGVDGETWRHYGEDLEANLRDLSGRLKRGAYRAKPVRRAYIPKADGRQRPLGVPTLEDKIVQRAVVEVLNAIYEADFLGFSYGFRPKRSPHQALDALTVGVMTRKVNWALDADIRSFFDTLSHGWLVKFVEHRVADRRVVRLIQKWLSAGVLEDGERTCSEVGTVQGGSISPLLANVYLHYVFDLWVQRWRTKQGRGDVVVVRFCDDFVVGFEHRVEAERFLAELRERFARFGLELHPDKTRLIEFGRYADRDRRRRGAGKPESFNFLGFTHSCTKTRSGKFTVLRQTMRTRWQAKLKEVKAELRRRLHDSVPEQGAYLRSVVGGHIRYYGVPMNGPALNAFRFAVGWTWWRALRRRSQTSRLNARRLGSLVTRWLPPAHICHPYPLVRLGVATQGGSRMR